MHRLLLILFGASALCVVLILASGGNHGILAFMYSVRRHPIFIAVMSEEHLSNEDKYSYKTTFSSLISRGLIKEVAYFGTKQPKMRTEYPYISVPKVPDASLNKLVSKFMFAIQYFLTSTRCLWMIRITNDVSININTFPYFIEELRTLPDPVNFITIQGSCLTKRGKFYLQGGSGYVLSRKAAEVVLENQDFLYKKAQKIKGDDRVFGGLIEHLGIPRENTTSRWFVGHQFKGYINSSQAIRSGKEPKVCPEVVTTNNGCRPFLTRIKDIVFWHDRSSTMDFLSDAANLREEAGEDLYFHMGNYQPLLCRGTYQTHSGYF